MNRYGLHGLEQFRVVSVIDRHVDEDWTGRLERLAELWRDFSGRVDPHAGRPKRFGVLHDVNVTKCDTVCRPYFGSAGS